jgi:hypothetical protein
VGVIIFIAGTVLSVWSGYRYISRNAKPGLRRGDRGAMNFEQPAWTRMIPPALVLNLGPLGPLGTQMPAPGTWGSAAGLLFFWLCFYQLGIVNVIAAACAAYFAVGICGEAEIQLGKHDPGEVILDEFVAMPLCFIGWGWLAGELSVPGLMPSRASSSSGSTTSASRSMINSLQESARGLGHCRGRHSRRHWPRARRST